MASTFCNSLAADLSIQEILKYINILDHLIPHKYFTRVVFVAIADALLQVMEEILMHILGDRGALLEGWSLHTLTWISV